MTLPGRLALLVVLAAGFLTMHGFLAVSAGAAAHGTTRAVLAEPVAPVQDDHAAGHLAGPAITSPAMMPPAGEIGPAQVPTGAPSPEPHPADHHGLLAGCAVALVGVAVMALVHLLARHRPLGVGRPLVTVPRALSWVADHAPALPPPRIALCVVRV